MTVFDDCERTVADAIRLGQEFHRLAEQDSDPERTREFGVAMATMALALQELAKAAGALYEAKT